MSSGCGDVLSLADLQTAKKHQLFEAEVITGKQGGVASGADIDYATNQVTAQVQKTMPAILRDAGFRPASFDFTTGGTLTTNDRDKVVYDPVSKTWYSWGGTLPHVIAAGTNPVGAVDWTPQTDPTLREDLAEGDGSGIGVTPQGTLKDSIFWITPEQFGALGDGSADDTAAMKAMLSYCNNVPTSLPNATAVAGYLEAKTRYVYLSSLYRTTETLYIPPGVSILAPASNYFSRVTKNGIVYDPVDKNTAAISLMVFRKQIDGSYNLNTDVNYYPTGADIDSGNAATCARKIELVNLNIVTAPGVKIGIKWIGGAGCVTKGLSIGENTSSDISTARLPLVGLLQSCSWGSVHDNLRVLYKSQGCVFIDSNGGAVVSSPYVSRLGNTGGELETTFFKPAAFTNAGDIAITQFAGSEVRFEGPILGQASYDFVHAGRDSDSYGLLMVNRPHIESSGGKKKHSFYLINTSSEVTFSGVGLSGTDPDLDSVYFLKNCPETAKNIVKGQLPLGGVKLVRGSGAFPTLVLDTVNTGSQFQFGQIGDIYFLKDVIGVTADTLYVDPVNGDNYNWGLNGSKPIRELANIAKICSLFKCKSMYLAAGTAAISSNTELPLVSISGPGTLSATAGSSFTISKGGSISLIGLSGFISDGGHLIRVKTTEPVNIHTNCAVNSLTAYVVLCEQQSYVNLRHLFYAINCAKYVGATAGQSLCGLLVKTASRPTAIDSDPTDSNTSLTYKIIGS